MKKTMKFTLLVCLVLLACVLTFTACGDGNVEQDNTPNENTSESQKDEVSVGEDGYVVVNGVKTDHKVHTGDEISVNADGFVVVNGVTTAIVADKDDVISVDNNGFLVVNGIKTEHKIHTEPVITVEDGYVAVNGVKTEYEVNTADVITVENGYLVVNGVKTEHEVKNKNHSFSDWKLYNESEIDCEKKLYYRTCPDCSTIEWKEGNYEDHTWNTVTTQPTCQAGGYDTKTCTTCGKVEVCNETSVTDHDYGATYLSDNEYHWLKCANCEATNGKAEHEENAEGVCSTCDALIGATNGLVYDVSADGTYAEVIGYNGTATRIKIAEEYNGRPVTKITDVAFEGKAIVSIIIPESVTSIGIKAFQNCNYLTSITIPNCVTSIGNYAFYGCTRLTSITIPNDLTSIEHHTFTNCSALNAIRIPDSVTSIGGGAFYGCSSLTSVAIGTGITFLGDGAFGDCYNLANVYITDIEQWCNIEFYEGMMSTAGASCNPLYYADNLYLNGELVTELIIPAGVTSIGDRAFYNCRGIVSITIPDSVTSIGVRAFHNCNRLASITIPNGLTSIGNYAFYGCTGLTSITISNSVTSIGSGAFYGCTGLTSITIPNSVTSIGSLAFSGCTELTSVIFESTLTWYITDGDNMTGGTSISVSNAFTNAKNFKSTYCGYDWYKK